MWGSLRIAILFTVALSTLMCGRAEAKNYDELVRGWQTTQVEPLVFVFEKPKKKQSAIFSVSPADITVEESNSYVKSTAFARDAKRIRERDLGKALDTQVAVAGDAREFQGTSVGIIETRFQAEGRQILITEHVWVKNRLVFHFIVTTKNVVEQPSQIHTEVFEEFLSDFALRSQKSASLYDLFIPRAEATESAAPRGAGRGAGQASRPRAQGSRGGLPENCVDRAEILNIPSEQLRPGPPALHPAASMRSCQAGFDRAWAEMEASLNNELTQLGRATEVYLRQQDCDRLNPNSAAARAEKQRASAQARVQGRWAQFSNFVTQGLGDSGLAEAYNSCLTRAGTRAIVDRYVAPAARSLAQSVRGGAESFARNPAQAAMTALIATNPALMVTRAAIWAGTGDNLQQAYNLVSTQITGFTCLKNELQTEAFCAFATKAAPALIVAAAATAATGGGAAVAGAAARGAQVASALQKGLTAARATIAANARRVAAASQRRIAASAAATAERRAVAASAARVQSGAAARVTGRNAPDAPSARATTGGRTRPEASSESAGAAAAPPTNVASRIATSPTEVLATADEMAVLTGASSRSALASDGLSVLSSTAPGQRLTVSVTRQGRTVSQPVTREEALDLARDPSVTSLRVESVRPMGTTPRLTAAQTRKISPELTQTLAGYKPDSVVQVMVRYRSGEVGVFSGNPQMIRGLAARNDVVGVDTGIGAPSWIRPAYAIDEAARTGASPLTTMRSQLGEGSVITSGAELNYSNQVVFHGTVRENVASVRAGPQNVGAGFGGRGLYVALDNERDLAEGYSNLASQAAVNRVSNVAAVTDASAIDRTAVVMRGRLNPNRNFRVGVFEVDRNAFAPDLRTGRLPANWDDDPRLRELMESEFDVIEIRNARRNGMNISSDRYLVVHERAGADAVTWQRTDVTNRPPRPAAAAAALPVNTQNVRMAEQVWRENGAPSRNFLPQLNVAERQQYAARVLSTGEMNARQATAFQRTAREFREDLWSDEAGMAAYRRSASENLRRAGFTDDQIGTMFDSGAITGARPRR